MVGDITNNDLKGIRVLLLEGFARQVMPLIHALFDLGCHVTTYNSSKLDMGYSSRFPDKKLIAFWDRNDEEKSLKALIEVLQKDKYDVIIPLTDFSATLLSKNKEILNQYASIAVNDWETFQMTSDKQNTMMACMENDIPCPYTLKDVETIDDILTSDIKYPFVLKPRTGYGSIGFHRINNEKELRKTFNKAVIEHGKLLVQEYIPQTLLQYQAEFFVDRNNNIKSAVVFSKNRWFPVDGGSSILNQTINKPEIIELCSRLLKAINWRGYADVDLIHDPKDGLIKIIEINPRITAGVKICFAAGVDFARQIIEHETGKEVTKYQDYKKGICLRYMHTDILWFIKSPERFRATPSWFKFSDTIDQIFSQRDVFPFFTYTLQAILKYKKEMKKRKR